MTDDLSTKRFERIAKESDPNNPPSPEDTFAAARAAAEKGDQVCILIFNKDSGKIQCFKNLFDPMASTALLFTAAIRNIYG